MGGMLAREWQNYPLGDISAPNHRGEYGDFPLLLETP